MYESTDTINGRSHCNSNLTVKKKIVIVLTVETLHAKQKERKQGRDDSVKQFSIQPHPIDLSTLKICRVELCVLCYHPYLLSLHAYVHSNG